MSAAVSRETPQPLDARLASIVTLADVLVYAVEHVGQTLDSDSVLEAARRIQADAQDLRNRLDEPAAPVGMLIAPQRAETVDRCRQIVQLLQCVDCSSEIMTESAEMGQHMLLGELDRALVRLDAGGGA